MRLGVRMLQYLLGLFLLSLCLMLLTVPLSFAVLISGLLVFSIALSKEKYAVAIVSLVLFMTFGLIELVLRVIPSDARPQYYRPHELLANHSINGALANYKPNQRIANFRIPYGDLGAMSSIDSIMEPRTVSFYTDSLGFRNEQDYAGQHLVVFGDSFVVGTGNGQRDILSEVLTHTHRIPTYNAGYPADIKGYIERIGFFRQTYGADFKAIVVVFEGNDFSCSKKHLKALASRLFSVEYIPKFVRGFQSYRLFYGMTRRAYHVLTTSAQASVNPVVWIESLGNKEVGFLKKYVKRSKRQEGCAWEQRYHHLFERESKQIALVVFVPTKYRVYKSLLPEGGEELPTAAPGRFLQDLTRDLSLPYLDLTPFLISASKRLLRDGRYTFWRDDTHWNGDGIRVAGDAIAQTLYREGLVPDISVTKPTNHM